MNQSNTTLRPAESNVLELPATRRASSNNKKDFGEPFTQTTAAANRRHDKAYGWSKYSTREYTNMARLPEYVKVPPGLTNDEDVWAALQAAEEVRRAKLIIAKLWEEQA